MGIPIANAEMMNTLSTGWWLQAISKTLVNCHHQVEWYRQNPGKKSRDDFPFYVCSYRQPTLRHKYMPGGCEYACKFPSGWETHLKIEHENPRWTLNTNPQKPIKTHLKHLWCGSETLSSSLAPNFVGKVTTKQIPPNHWTVLYSVCLNMGDTHKLPSTELQMECQPGNGPRLKNWFPCWKPTWKTIPAL
jgi:hypothetical protein